MYFNSTKAKNAAESNEIKLQSGTNSSESIENGAESDIIKAELFRKKDFVPRSDVKVISEKVFDGLTIEARKKGASLIRCSYGDEIYLHLEKENASAACLNNVLIFRPDVTISEVLEEIYHYEQNCAELNFDKEVKLMTLLNEIDAKKYLLSVSRKYSIPRREIEETKLHLAFYQTELKKYFESSEEGNEKSN